MNIELRWISFRKLAIASSISVACFGASPTAFAQEAPKLDLVKPNQADEPRHTPLTRPAMKQYLEDLKNRTLRFTLPELTEEEKKQALTDSRSWSYEARLRALYLNEGNGNSYLPFGGTPAGGYPGQNTNRPNNPQDPVMSLDYAFKTRLFWIAARANNCQYCLGHQESKLLAAGMQEDNIAALDGNWQEFPAKEQVAFSLARKLTQEPYLVTDADIDACRPYYSDVQIIEMLGSVSGNNAINRWKEGAGIPQSSNGGNFGRSTRDAAASNAPAPKEESHSYLTPTSEKYLTILTKVATNDSKLASSNAASIVPTRSIRPSLETGAALKTALDRVSERKSRLELTTDAKAREIMGDLVGTGKVPTWLRLLSHYPVAGKKLASGILGSQESDELSPALQSEIDWVIARQDRAWYAARLALDRMNENRVGERVRAILDSDFESAESTSPISDRDRHLLVVAKNLAASPIVLTDKQVADAVQAAGAKAVVQTINYAAYRAAFDRFTEAAGLPME